jgi:hypothetical protein
VACHLMLVLHGNVQTNNNQNSLNCSMKLLNKDVPRHVMTIPFYGRFKHNALKGFPYRIHNFSSRCMHLYLTCPSIICTHNIPNVTHTLCQIKAKLSHIIFCTPRHVFFPIGIVNQINKVDNIAYPWNKFSVE